MNGIFPAWIGPYSISTTTEIKYIERESSSLSGGGIFYEDMVRKISVTASIMINKKRKNKPKVKVKFLNKDRT